MHELDADDSAGGLYVAGPPKTVLGRHAQNAKFQEIKNAVLKSGQTLASAGSADFAETAWLQLAKAIAEFDTDGTNKVQSCQWQDTDDASPTDASADFNVQYVRHSLRRLMSLNFPNASFTLTGSRAALYLRTSAAAALPSDWGCEIGTMKTLIVGSVGGSTDLEPISLGIIGTGAPQIILERMGGASFPSGVVALWATSINYLSEDPVD